MSDKEFGLMLLIRAGLYALVTPFVIMLFIDIPLDTSFPGYARAIIGALIVLVGLTWFMAIHYCFQGYGYYTGNKNIIDKEMW